MYILIMWGQSKNTLLKAIEEDISAKCRRIY